MTLDDMMKDSLFGDGYHRPFYDKLDIPKIILCFDL